MRHSLCLLLFLTTKCLKRGVSNIIYSIVNINMLALSRLDRNYRQTHVFIVSQSLHRTAIRLILLSLVVILTAYQAVGQSSDAAIDELEKIYFLLRAHPDSAKSMLIPFLTHSSDSVRGKAHNLMGNGYYYKSSYDSAIYFYSKSAAILIKSGDEANLAKNYNNIGVCEYFMSRYETSFEFHKKALEIRKGINDPQISSSYNNLGLVLSELGSHDEALANYKKALKEKLRFGQYAGLSTTLTNISNCFSKLNIPDSSLVYDFKNLAHLDTVPDQRNLATCLNNIGLFYQRKGDFSHAESYIKRALKMEKDLQRGYEIVNVCGNLSLIHLNLHRPYIANAYLDSVFILVNNAEEYRGVLAVYQRQAEIDSILGDFREAFLHANKYITAKRHFDEQERKNQVLALEKKYEGEIKEQKITELEQTNLIKDLEAARARQWRIYLLIIVTLLLISAVVLYSRYQLKRKSEQALDEKNKQLETLNQYKDRLFAIISHDLKSPLSSFSSITSTLNEYFEQISPEDAKGYLAKLSQSARSLEGQMKNLLEWAMNQLAENKIKVERVQLKKQIEELRMFFHLNLDIKNQQLYVEVDETLELETDREYLQTILRNLISNAIKFTPVGGSVWVKAKYDEDKVMISIKDSGIGIANDDFEKLFSLVADKRGIGSSDEKGTGLGLVLVKEMLDKLGGVISLESELGLGTTFAIQLPLIQMKKAA